MFIDTKLRPQGEVQQVGKLKLSEAIRKGAPTISESDYRFHRIAWSCCAIGAAHKAVTGKKFNSSDYWPEVRSGEGIGVVEVWAMKHGFDPHMARAAQEWHDHECLSHDEVAARLESQGY